MDPIAKIRNKLEQDPRVRLETTDTAVTVSMRDGSGFPVRFEGVDGEYRVFFDGWHEHFEDEDEALACLAFGLSSRCRLVTTYRGDRPVKWTVESREGDSWRVESTTGLLLVPFWRRRRIESRSNSLELS